MVQPLSWPRIQALIDNNVARRFRVREADKARRDAVIRQFVSRAAGRWGFCVVGDDILLGIEDPEDIQLVKVLFYTAFRKNR
jgi:hypothetical protein